MKRNHSQTGIYGVPLSGAPDKSAARAGGGYLEIYDTSGIYNPDYTLGIPNDGEDSPHSGNRPETAHSYLRDRAYSDDSDERLFYSPEFLRTHIGDTVRAVYFEQGTIEDIGGILAGVGCDYILIRPIGQNITVFCELSALKRFSLAGKRSGSAGYN